MKKKSLILFTTIISITVIMAACSSKPVNDGNYEKAYMADSPEDFKELGINETETEIWEDGMRTDGKEGTYEWWYVDAELNDGITVVAVFFTKYKFDLQGPAQPTATLTITYPDGTVIFREISEPAGTVMKSSKEKADVNVGDSYLRYVDGDYELYFHDGTLEFNAMMKNTSPMWRPDTGYNFYGENKDYMGWFVAQPSSDIQATLTMDGQSTELTGTGYHDHNWGNVAMSDVMNHWYWGRATLEGYTIIFSDVISEENTGYTRLPVGFIAKDGVILADDYKNITVSRDNTEIHPETGKFIDNNLIFTHKGEDGTNYTVEMIRETDIVVNSLLDSLSPVKRTLAKMLGANPTYIRTLGEVILTIEKEGEVEVIEQEGLWEQMFFGNNKEAYIWN
jgi:hypothetical protein